MKKVVFVLPTIGFGGAEKVYIELASYLNEKTNYRIILIYLTKIDRQRNLPTSLTTICLNKPDVKSSFFGLKKILKEIKPDVVFSNISHLNILLSLIKFLYGFEFKLFLRHTSILSMESNRNIATLIKHRTMKIFYQRADLVIFQSEYMKADFVNQLPIKRYIVINNPVNVESIFANAKETKNVKDYINVIFIGRLNAGKNLNYVLKCLKESASQEMIQLHVLGEGKEKERLIQMSRSLGLQDSVKFYGNVVNPYPILKNMDFLINASKSEGFPNVLLEALALDVPIFVRRHPGGTKELMEKMGLLEYFLSELNFDLIIEMLKSYPNVLSERVKCQYGIERVVNEYITLIEGECSS